MATRASSKVTTDHDEIRRWAEERGAQPACVRGTGDEGDIGVLRLEFPGAPGARDESLQPISWDDWFRKFDERGLALLYQDETARGQKSNFNKIVSRETAAAEPEREGTKKGRRSGRRTGKRLAVAVAAGRLRSRLRRKSTKSASKKSSSGARRTASRKKTTKAASGTRRAGRKTSTRATASKKSSRARKAVSTKRADNVRSIASARGGARSGHTASGRGRVSSRRSGRRAA